MKHDTHVCYVNLVFHSYSRLFLLYIISQFYSFALHPHHSAQKGWTDLFQLNIIKHQQKPFPQSAEVSEDFTSHLCKSWTIKVGLHNTRTLVHEPAVTVSRKYGSTELQDTKYKAALGKLLPDSLSWKNEVYFE